MATDNDIQVLREMIRIAENRRIEEKEMLNRITSYNLALIAFSGSFLSLLVTAQLPLFIVNSAGLFSLFSILMSLFTIRPKVLKGSTLLINDDVKDIQEGKKPDLALFLLVTAQLTEQAADAVYFRAIERKRTTIISAVFLALSLFITYSLYGYA